MHRHRHRRGGVTPRRRRARATPHRSRDRIESIPAAVAAHTESAAAARARSRCRARAGGNYPEGRGRGSFPGRLRGGKVEMQLDFYRAWTKRTVISGSSRFLRAKVFWTGGNERSLRGIANRAGDHTADRMRAKRRTPDGAKTMRRSNQAETGAQADPPVGPNN
jgi:hypothetical protein